MDVGEEAQGGGYVNIEEDVLSWEEDAMGLHGEETDVIGGGVRGGLVGVQTDVRGGELEGGMTTTGFAHGMC